jgi:hypothetical protein
MPAPSSRISPPRKKGGGEKEKGGEKKRKRRKRKKRKKRRNYIIIYDGTSLISDPGLIDEVVEAEEVKSKNKNSKNFK